MPSAISTPIQKLQILVFALSLSSSVALAQRGYVRSDGVNSVVYEGTDAHVWELFLAPGSNWQLGDLSYYAGAPPGFLSQVPAPYVRSDNFNSVMFQGQDNHLYEIFLGGDGWDVGDLSDYAGAPPAYSFPAPYVRSDGFNSVVYVGGDYHMYEIFLAGDGWEVGDLSAITGAPPVWSNPAPYVSSGRINSVVYVGTNSRVYEIYLSGGWRFSDLSALSGAPLADAYVTAYVRSDRVNSVVYRGLQDNHIYEIYSLPRGWGVRDLTAISGAPPADDYSLPAAYVRSDGFNSVLFRGYDSHVYEIFLVRGGAQFGDLTAITGAPPVDYFSDPRPYIRTGGINSIVYFGANGHVYEMFLRPGERWGFGDLTAEAGG